MSKQKGPKVETQEPPIVNAETDLDAQIETTSRQLKGLSEKKARLQAEADAKARAEHEAADRAKLFWPAGKALPMEHTRYRRKPQPCPKCRRLLLDNLSQAASCVSVREKIALYRCKACGHNWKMSVIDA